MGRHILMKGGVYGAAVLIRQLDYGRHGRVVALDDFYKRIPLKQQLTCCIIGFSLEKYLSFWAELGFTIQEMWKVLPIAQIVTCLMELTEPLVVRAVVVSIGIEMNLTRLTIEYGEYFESDFLHLLSKRARRAIDHSSS